ncbi:hypothetical protein, partial [Pseudomonas viridiflava]|uniref:hypothetical protein n=1 Tax=Pseudomonas viridiflava TaxID=33069 RepID=UPI00197FFB8E
RHIVENSLPIVREKVDAAVNVLNLPKLSTRTDLAIGLFLGSTPGGRDELANLLTAVRLNICNTSVSNFVLDSAKVDDQTIRVSQTQYSEWKNA